MSGDRKLSPKLALVLWELILGHGGAAKGLSIELDEGDVAALENAGLIDVGYGPSNRRKTGARTWLFVTDAGWTWANGAGLASRLAKSPAAVHVLEVLLAKLGDYLKLHDLTLDDLLRPRKQLNGQATKRLGV